MKIIYCHHALRQIKGKPTQEDDITLLGEEDAKLVSQIFALGSKKENFKAIYTSNFFRCEKTANIINDKLNLPIIFDSRLNEFGSVENENWLDLQNRVREVLKEIVFKYNDDDTVICVTSGVNIVAFMSVIFGLKPDEKAPFVGVPSCSPMIFKITKDMF